MTDELQLPQQTPGADARQWAMFCHFAAFAGLIIPFGNIVGPLLIWQLKKDMDPFVDAQGKEALNFQITVALAALVCFGLMVVLIGFPLLMLVSLTAFVLTVIAGVKANEGKDYRYPFTLRLVK
ncbi:DUF4870 domain-containing protein [Ectopseudomonas mendocina]|uniref:DUF4870 domain-containing protein n=1 Tax=Ectopseudomonas mendocina TaxID=300 RepID=A0ABZ2RNC0_ECTME